MQELAQTNLVAEKAIVFGRAGMHERALHLLIYELNDHEMAREYCNENTRGGTRKQRQKLFLSLLKARGAFSHTMT